MIPAYGFGALFPRVMGGKAAFHKFALNGDCFNPECNGIDGVEACYHNVLRNAQLYGPTNFSEIISDINDRCEAIEVSAYNQEYHLLMIITDGIISDINKTIDEIVRGSSLPLSIVIVGVGDANFDQMDVLDADTVPLKSQRYNRVMARDIV